MSVKPIAQHFSDDLTALCLKYGETELTNAECIGVLEMYIFQIQFKINLEQMKLEKPY